MIFFHSVGGVEESSRRSAMPDILCFMSVRSMICMDDDDDDEDDEDGVC